MKRVLALIVIAAAAVLLIGVVSVSAAPKTVGAVAGSGEPAVSAVRSADVQQDGIVREDDMVIDLNLVTTLIISICSVLTVGVIVLVVYLGRKNRR